MASSNGFTSCSEATYTGYYTTFTPLNDLQNHRIFLSKQINCIPATLIAYETYYCAVCFLQPCL